ncbi:MAG: hypothetical protein OXC11_11050 [Rhodospirillales bacterium]|nr:hypothetical protein [Rhodospirillales bacterium]
MADPRWSNAELGVGPPPKRFELIGPGLPSEWFDSIPDGRKWARKNLNGHTWAIQEHCNLDIPGATIQVVDVWNSSDERNVP